MQNSGEKTLMMMTVKNSPFFIKAFVMGIQAVSHWIFCKILLHIVFSLFLRIMRSDDIKDDSFEYNLNVYLVRLLCHGIDILLQMHEHKKHCPFSVIQFVWKLKLNLKEPTKPGNIYKQQWEK